MNAAWHKQHPLPRSASAVRRLAWHLAHQRFCGCRKLTPDQLRRLISAARKTLPRRRASRAG